MLKNDNTPAAPSPETLNTNKTCASALKTVLGKHREKLLPPIRERQDVDSQNLLKTPLPSFRAPLQVGKNENRLNSSEMNSGIALKRVYNVEKAEVVNHNLMRRGKRDNSKDRKHHSGPDRAHREQIKRTQRITYNPQIQNQEKNLTPQQKLEEKLRKRATAEKALNKRMTPSQPVFSKPNSQPTFSKPTTQPGFSNPNGQPAYFRPASQPAFSNPTSQPGFSNPNGQPAFSDPTIHPGFSTPTPSSSDQKRSLENRITRKIWQILSRDVFLLDHEEFSNQIQATNSETKNYIISVIKKCNNRECKKLNRPKRTQTMKENSLGKSYRAKKKSLKIAVRRKVWALAKASIKRSKHWTQFLAENNIIVENINIDKFDLSLIDLEALGIENKLLKRTVTWLFN